MKNILLVVEYDGRDFSGWQVQPNQRTVEGELKLALEKATKEKIKIVAAGRTDKLVHSLGQVVNFKTHSNIPGENYKLLLDFLLPEDITIKDSKEVEESFHARFDAKKRLYKYLVYNRYFPNALYRNYSYHWPYPVDLRKMKLGAEKLIGRKDFTAFKASGSTEVNPIREIYSIDIKKFGDFIEFKIVGNSFLHKMVRIIVGTLLYVGINRIDVEDIENIINSRKRENAGITAGAQGLYLKEVFYK